ncbi:zinc finger CCCH domain-containing protein 39-like [Vicia villosa]|uniref:zinc finger CCCH domain-containing protein 39-like n=1 Tax=Vicia villosa TaxID=3911 RepID=UPI00273C6C7C|nr:zinc finger CCCH domain-containing protein 39-like [Vicia villosa]
MSYSDIVPTFTMSPPQFSSSSTSDHSHSFIRTRVSDKYHSNALMGPPPSRGRSNIFFKTRICIKFGFGSCRNGQNCSFAHGVEDIRQPPPNWQELVRPRTEERLQLGGNSNDDQKIIHKMKLCKKYCNGEQCPYGDKCNFLHEDPAKFRDDSWKTRESSAISAGTFGDGSNNLEGNRVGTEPARGTYSKTKMCLRWLNTGSCPFDDNCHFAHGDAELQAPGGAIEAEAAVAIANSTKATTSPASVPAATEEEKKTKKELLWLKLNKINRIYGDWIDDLPLGRPDLPREP